MTKGSRTNKFAILGVEASGRQGVKAQEYLDIPSIATQSDGMLRRPKCEVIFERALRPTIAGQIQRMAL